ncbi:MAG: 3'-5' exonuclease [Gemmatimonadales bacterium]
MTDKLESLAAQLDASPDYRVLRRFVPPSRYHEGDGSATAMGVVVDVETTGLDTARDKIIEFCGVPFEFEKESGRILTVGEAVSCLEDPGRPIPAEVTRLTGITDEMVAGKSIDEQAVAAMLAEVGLVIAHNAGFDRPFVDRRLASFKGKAWACSQREVPWKALGVSSGALEFLLMKRCQLFFDGHRADADCHAVLRLLQEPFDDGTLPLQTLLESARTPSFRVWALNSAYDKKDVLKQRRYRWSGGEGGLPKAWYTSVAEDGLTEEESWLSATVYGGGTGWKVERMDARSRYAEAE